MKNKNRETSDRQHNTESKEKANKRSKLKSSKKKYKHKNHWIEQEDDYHDFQHIKYEEE